jgi:hypothetical protein
MKHFACSSALKVLVFAICILSFFTKCTQSVNETNCDGYTGPVTNKQALALQAKCHFMPKDTIAVWTERYQKNKPTTAGAPLPPASSAFGDSCSFNNSIVRAIITNDSCIGLRVIYGMDEINKVHIILVGIKPDYSTLYIRKPKNCGLEKNMAAKDGDGDGDDDLGGGEWADNP